ncbi:hypothetical protein ACO22_05601 [Paracoccidioides brasiliensis]|uniref:Uncharacterized protein n=1 Tax=Paracoccidioides brasiliensis TaxID=121759 RepID=A0A1D2J9U2_PARBR|nr:hypothetical protein ACO22_05601 [Paracoccidioides brasiliensis]
MYLEHGNVALLWSLTTKQNSLELLTSSLQSRRASSPKDMRDTVAGGFKPSIVQLSQLTRHRDSRQLRS